MERKRRRGLPAWSTGAVATCPRLRLLLPRRRPVPSVLPLARAGSKGKASSSLARPPSSLTPRLAAPHTAALRVLSPRLSERNAFRSLKAKQSRAIYARRLRSAPRMPPQQEEPHHRQPLTRPAPPAPAPAPTTPPPIMASYSDDMAAFYDAWARREEELAAALTTALTRSRRRGDALAPLVDAAVDHVAAYYEHKSRLADRDVVAALDPRWLNPLERTFLWAWGWKPALVFRFVPGAGGGGGGGRAMEELRAATAAAEREVEREVAAVQESLAGPRVLAALRRPAQRDGEGAAAEEAVAAVGRSLRVLLGTADALRERTLRAVVGLLGTEQAAAFLAAMLKFHISVRRAGRDWSSGGGM